MERFELWRVEIALCFFKGPKISFELRRFSNYKVFKLWRVKITFKGQKILFKLMRFSNYKVFKLWRVKITFKGQRMLLDFRVMESRPYIW